MKYADDGVSQQCNHTAEMLRNELTAADLGEDLRLEKVYYPWELTMKLDYGYFPNAPEQIWDWLITAC
jgi:hypothetical protein